MKFKYLLSIILVFAFCFGVLNLAFADEAAEVPEGYTPIYTAEDLYNIRNDLDGKYILMNDIDLSVYENWEPIGTSETPFTGELDGNGYAISNLKIDAQCESGERFYFGLFGVSTGNFIDETIKNLSLTDININVEYIGNGTAKCLTGAFIGYGNSVSVSNCAVSGSLTVKGFPSAEIGGIFGKNKYGSSSECANFADIEIITDSSTTLAAVGGISGTTEGGIVKCSNFGKITVSGNTTDSVVKIGGIIGDGSLSSLINSINNEKIYVNVSTIKTYAGGLAGESSIIENSCNTDEIILPDNFSGYAGGVSGSLKSGVLSIGNTPHMKNVYYINAGMTPSYDEEKNIDDLEENYRNRTFDNVKPLTEEEFKKQESFVGFDFENIWKMKENGYPILQNQPVLPVNIPERPTTTESTTEPSTESDTESTKEPSTESSFKPGDNDCPFVFWFVNIVNCVANYLTGIINCFIVHISSF